MKLIILGIFLLLIPATFATNASLQYVWNESCTANDDTCWIPWLATTEGKPRVDINLLNVSAGSLDVSGAGIIGTNLTIDSTTLHVDSNTDRVGIGMVTPTSPLHVSGNANITSILYVGQVVANRNDQDLYIRADDGGDIWMGEASENWFFLQGANNRVGIGTTNPGQELHLIGSANITGNITSPTFHDVSSEGLILALNLNNNSVTDTQALDSSGQNNHGTHNATFNATGSYDGTGAFDFTGPEIVTTIDMEDRDAWRFGTEDFTISFWVKFANTQSTGTAIGRYTGEGANNFIIDATSGQMRYYFFNSTGGRADGACGDWISTKAITANTWYHAVYVQKNDAVTTYLNGEQDGYCGDFPQNITGNQNLHISTYNGKAVSFNGSVDNVRIYKRGLSGQEVKNLYLQRSEPIESFVSQKHIHVNSTGHIGIGTTTPNTILDIAQSTSGSSIDVMRIINDGTGHALYIDQTTGDDENPAVYIRVNDNGGTHPALYLEQDDYFSSAPALTVHTDSNGAYAMRVEMDYDLSAAGHGINVQYTGSAPDDNTYRFLLFGDTSATRAQMFADGDWQNHDNAYGAISDIRLKENIENAPEYLAKLLQVPIRKYSFKIDNLSQANDIGVIAQEIEPHFPDLVYEDAEGNFAVTYSKFTPILIKSLQEQQSQIEELKKEIQALKSNQ